MATLEMVEKLRERANVSYDEAKAALNASGDDLLEALIYLEKQGKTTPPSGGGFYSSKGSTAQQQDGTEDEAERIKDTESFGRLVRRFGAWLGRLLHKGNTNLFEVWRGGSCTMSLPVTVLVVLLFFFFWIVLPLLVVGLFFGFRYRFRGRDMEKTGVNNLMDSAAKAADNFKHDVIHPDEENGNL